MALDLQTIIKEVTAFKRAGGSIREAFKEVPDKAPEDMGYVELLGATCLLLASRKVEMAYSGNVPIRNACAGLQGAIEPADFFPTEAVGGFLPGVMTGNLTNFKNAAERFLSDDAEYGGLASLNKLDERERKVISFFATRVMDKEIDLGVKQYVKDSLDAQKRRQEEEAARKAEEERRERERQKQLEQERQRAAEEERRREKERQEQLERERIARETKKKQELEVEGFRRRLHEQHTGYVNQLKENTQTVRNSIPSLQSEIEEKKRELEQVKKLLEKETEELKKRKAETEYQEEIKKEKEKEEKKEEKKKEEEKEVKDAASGQKKDESQTIQEAEHLAAARKAFVAEREKEKRQVEQEYENAHKEKEALEQEKKRILREKRALEDERKSIAMEQDKVEAAWRKKMEPFFREKEKFDSFVENSAFEEAQIRERREREEREKWDRFAEDSAYAETADRKEREKWDTFAENSAYTEAAENAGKRMKEESAERFKVAEEAAAKMREKDLPTGEDRMAAQRFTDNRALRNYYFNTLTNAYRRLGLSEDEIARNNDTRFQRTRSQEFRNVSNLIGVARRQLEVGVGNLEGFQGTMKAMKEYCITYLNKYPKVRSTQAGRDSYEVMLNLLATCAAPGDADVEKCIKGINAKRGVAGRPHAKDYIDIRSYGPDRLLGKKKGAADLLKDTDKELVEQAKLADGGNKKAQAELKRLQIKKLYIKAAVPPNGAMYLEELDKSVTALTRNEGLVNALATAAEDPKKQDMIMIAEVNKQRGRNTHNRFYETPERKPLAADEVERRLGQKPVRDALDQINKDFTL